ncbi:PepSY domain-containing protein [Pseudofulvibacter geojedonensis]|uniref:NADPH--hemoprotein reductase n=1 Tax=Pseudofulvibacter geojedonensis TaxID=1123758 RepID=A0ABW3I296_9FLAO
MTLSIWRYSHLGFALSFSVFILLASITGIILAFEPINEQVENHHISSVAKEQTVANTIAVLKKEYIEVVSFEINTHNQALADVVTKDGENKQVFINPINGKIIGIPKDTHPIFKWTTNLHRSLFLKKTGRFIVGLCSLFLCLIAITGIILICKRQGGVLQFFSKIVKENSNQYFHIILGRWSLIPILILTLTGIYLSLEKFSLLPEKTINYQIDFDNIKAEPKTEVENFIAFKNIQLKDVKQIEFPFSDNIEDYYTLYLTNKELVINQITGEVISEEVYPLSKLISYYSLILHTGHGSILWSLILLLACLGILYFLYSGFAMTLSRKSTKIKNPIKRNQAEITLLVGSEGGTTLNYANAFHQELLKNNAKSYLTHLNKFGNFTSLKKLIVITATYGDGEAPSNANKFLELIKKHPIQQEFEFSVLGFGSRAYQHFCKFAYDVQETLQQLPNSKEALKINTINNASFEAYTEWLNEVSNYLDVKLNIQKKDLGIKKMKTSSFKVLNITSKEKQVDNTFLLELSSLTNKKFNSGDLLAIYPKNDDRERLYSISKTRSNSLLVSVKRHQLGIVSNLLHQLEKADILDAAIVPNKEFHFPKKANKVVCIATGTGIGPFLGMIENNQKNIPIDLFWGGRNEASFSIYKDFILKQQSNRKLKNIFTAYSRTSTTKTYVQDLIQQQDTAFAELLENKGVIMICGSVAMQKEVLKVLDSICKEELKKPLSYYENKGQLLMDCY